MQQRIAVDVGVEIGSAKKIKVNVRREQRAHDCRVAQIDQIVRIVDGASGGKHACDHREIGWHDAADAAVVETADGETVFFQVTKDATGNQIARDDKEDVYAGEPARAKTSQNMEKHNRQHGKGTNAINVRIVLAVDDLGGVIGCGGAKHEIHVRKLGSRGQVWSLDKLGGRKVQP